MKDFFNKVAENVDFILVFAGVVIGVFVLAYAIEKLLQHHRGERGKIFTTRKIAMIGMFSAISGILMIMEFPLPFIAPPFYEVDFSELPVMICGFAFGPLAGVMAEFLKILIKLLFKSTSTAFVGDLANFAIGCTLVLPATVIYQIKKKKSIAIIGCITGVICMTSFGTAFNAIYLLPTFADMYGLKKEVILGMGAAIHSQIDSYKSLALFCVAPLNVLKGGTISLLTMLLYKPLSPIIKYNHHDRVQRKKKPQESNSLTEPADTEYNK